MKAESITDDKVIRAMFSFALGVVFLIMQFALEEHFNLFLTTLGVIWCLISLAWTIKNVREDWKS